MNFIKLISKWPKLVWHYIKISRSFDFMLRYIILWLLYLLNSLFFGKLEKIIGRMHPMFYKTFVFKTSFWTYLWKTVNHRTVLDPDYEPALRKIINQNYKKNHDQERIFVDIWAHIWRYAVELTKNYWYKTYAFEPSPETYKILKSNTILSGIESDIQVFNYALWDKEAEMFFDYREDNDASSKIIQNPTNKEKAIKVPVRIFDNLLSEIDSKKVRLIIMDVEWFEYQVLQGMTSFFQKAWDFDFIIEIMDDQERRLETIEFMHKLWFQSKKIDRDNYHFWK